MSNASPCVRVGSTLMAGAGRAGPARHGPQEELIKHLKAQDRHFAEHVPEIRRSGGTARTRSSQTTPPKPLNIAQLQGPLWRDTPVFCGVTWLLLPELRGPASRGTERC